MEKQQKDAAQALHMEREEIERERRDLVKQKVGHTGTTVFNIYFILFSSIAISPLADQTLGRGGRGGSYCGSRRGARGCWKRPQEWTWTGEHDTNLFGIMWSA